MSDINVIINANFEKLGLSVGQIFVKEKEDAFIIEGSLTFSGNSWKSDEYLRVNANLCDSESRILISAYDSTRKTFSRIDYDHFHIFLSKYDDSIPDYIEIFPSF